MDLLWCLKLSLLSVHGAVVCTQRSQKKREREEGGTAPAGSRGGKKHLPALLPLRVTFSSGYSRQLQHQAPLSVWCCHQHQRCECSNGEARWGEEGGSALKTCQNKILDSFFNATLGFAVAVLETIFWFVFKMLLVKLIVFIIIIFRQ